MGDDHVFRWAASCFGMRRGVVEDSWSPRCVLVVALNEDNSIMLRLLRLLLHVDGVDVDVDVDADA